MFHTDPSNKRAILSQNRLSEWLMLSIKSCVCEMRTIGEERMKA